MNQPERERQARLCCFGVLHVKEREGALLCPSILDKHPFSKIERRNLMPNKELEKDMQHATRARAQPPYRPDDLSPLILRHQSHQPPLATRTTPTEPNTPKDVQVGPDPPPAQTTLHQALFRLEQLVVIGVGVGVGVGGGGRGGEEDEARFAEVEQDEVAQG